MHTRLAAGFGAVAFLVSLHSACGLFGSSGATWDGLKVTFGINPFSSMNFDSLPRTLEEAKRAGWKLDVSVTCGSGSPFAGNRYILNDDTSAMILFDKNGYIAGIQCGIPKSMPNGYPAPNKFGTWIEEKNQWTVTAYFVEPSIVCTTGRSQADFDSQGTGTVLYLQNGSSAVANRIAIPLDEQAVAGTMWTKGKCFYMMGMHYWYNLRVDMTEDEFFPAFLLYNKGKLTGFGWAFNADIQGNRYEHPPKASFSSFMQTPPDFLVKLPYEVSTMHIYMTSSPRTNFC